MKLMTCALLVAALLGELVARLYSEPANRCLRAKWGESRLGSAIGHKGDVPEPQKQAI